MSTPRPQQLGPRVIVLCRRSSWHTVYRASSEHVQGLKEGLKSERLLQVSFGSSENLVMKQLSGGQKTLVALALIFAIQR